MFIDTYIEEQMAVIVARTNTALAAAVTAGDLPGSFPSEVFYMYGHYVEVISRLKQLSDSKDLKNKKYPLIVLFTDIPITPPGFGFFGKAKLQMVIVHYTDQNYHAPDRLNNVFKPILEPIKKELLNQISLYEDFTRPTELAYTHIRHYFWGSNLNQKNPFDDRLDAIELRDIDITIKNKIC